MQCNTLPASLRPCPVVLPRFPTCACGRRQQVASKGLRRCFYGGLDRRTATKLTNEIHFAASLARQAITSSVITRHASPRSHHALRHLTSKSNCLNICQLLCSQARAWRPSAEGVPKSFQSSRRTWALVAGCWSLCLDPCWGMKQIYLTMF